MSPLVGIALILLSAAILFYSVPRDGRAARFVGTHLEPYVTVLVLGSFVLGALLFVSGTTPLLDETGYE